MNPSEPGFNHCNMNFIYVGHFSNSMMQILKFSRVRFQFNRMVGYIFWSALCICFALWSFDWLFVCFLVSTIAFYSSICVCQIKCGLFSSNLIRMDNNAFGLIHSFSHNWGNWFVWLNPNGISNILW